MDNRRPEYAENEVVNSLWRRYICTSEYKSGRIYSINSTHDLIRFEESKGLARIINKFIGSLNNRSVSRSDYENRSVTEWLEEWYMMHDLLFKTVTRPTLRGRFRRIDVRFGSLGDDELHCIPPWQNVMREIQEYAADVSESLKYVDADNLDSICTFLARVHYKFIRIHPFEDGNGRIARSITDQLGISLGLPPIIAGFPRTNRDKKAKYHAAITSCAGDGNCESLKNWIKDQVEKKINDIA